MELATSRTDNGRDRREHVEDASPYSGSSADRPKALNNAN